MADNPLGVPEAWLGPVRLSVTTDGEGYARSRTTVRGHSVVLDEPPERDGTDQGPAPTEMLLTCGAGVTHVVLNRLARRDGRTLDAVHIDVEAVLDRRGVWLSEAIGCPWRDVRVAVVLGGDADEDDLRRWSHDLNRFSPVHSVFAAAGARLSASCCRGVSLERGSHGP